jgi:hypothetical protein
VARRPASGAEAIGCAFRAGQGRSNVDLHLVRGSLLLLAICCGQRQEVGRLTEERAGLVEANRGLMAEREQLRRRNEELSRRLGLDSTNSSRPPSSDGLKRKR